MRTPKRKIAMSVTDMKRTGHEESTVKKRTMVKCAARKRTPLPRTK